MVIRGSSVKLQFWSDMFGFACVSRRDIVALLLSGLLTLPGANVASAADKLVVGWVERVHIYPGAFEIHAKVDTGAKTSSLNAPNLKKFQRNGEEWVSFDVTNRRGVTRKFEAKVLRISRIRRHGGQFQRRPVIMMGLCIGSVYQETQGNLIDRKNFNYQMLVGRRFMAGRVVVDPGRTFIAKPHCNREADK